MPISRRLIATVVPPRATFQCSTMVSRPTESASSVNTNLSESYNGTAMLLTFRPFDMTGDHHPILSHRARLVKDAIGNAQLSIRKCYMDAVTLTRSGRHCIGTADGCSAIQDSEEASESGSCHWPANNTASKGFPFRHGPGDRWYTEKPNSSQTRRYPSSHLLSTFNHIRSIQASDTTQRQTDLVGTRPRRALDKSQEPRRRGEYIRFQRWKNATGETHPRAAGRRHSHAMAEAG